MAEEFPKINQELTGDKKEEVEKQPKRPAKVETPAYFVPTKKEAQEKKNWLKEKFDVWRHEK